MKWLLVLLFLLLFVNEFRNRNQLCDFICRPVDFSVFIFIRQILVV